jgi:hypothetical protein
MSFTEHLRWRYRVTPDDVTLSPVKGYWSLKQPCPGGEECRHAARMALGPCSGGGRVAIHYGQYDRDAQGRFLRPYREWERQWEEKGANDP